MQLESLVGHTFEIFRDVMKQLGVPQGIPPDSMLDSFFRSHRYLGSNDRKFVAGNVYAALRYYHRVHHQVTEALKDFRGDVFEDDKLFLVLLATMTSESIKSSDIPLLCRAFLKGNQLQQFVPKLLPRLLRSTISPSEIPEERLALEFSFPQWMIESFLQQFGERETEQLCAAFNKPAPITIRVNTLATTVEMCQARLNAEGIESERTLLAPHGLQLKKRLSAFSLQSFRDGWFEVQDEGSQLLAYFVDPKPSDRILDACAGAGGKTLAFAAMMKNRGEILATDVNAVRLQELRKRARRAGVHNVRVQEVTTLDELHSHYRGYFDIVFVDAPCTGLGTLRRNPGLKLSVTPETVHAVTKKQKQILDSVAPLVRENGRLFYVTCSVLRQENEDQCAAFLDRHPNFEPIVLKTALLDKPGIANIPVSTYLLLPHRSNTDGFFCAVFRRSR